MAIVNVCLWHDEVHMACTADSSNVFARCGLICVVENRSESRMTLVVMLALSTCLTNGKHHTGTVVD